MRHRTAVFILSIALIVSIAIIIAPVPDVYAQPDFHDSWVAECKEAHAHNMTYCLASGFWYEPRPDDASNPVLWPPSRDPESLPHGSITMFTDGEPSITSQVKVAMFCLVWAVAVLFLNVSMYVKTFAGVVAFTTILISLIAIAPPQGTWNGCPGSFNLIGILPMVLGVVAAISAGLAIYIMYKVPEDSSPVKTELAS